MVAYYNIAGAKVGSHWLSIATLSTMFVGAYLSTGGKKGEAQKTPAFNAKDQDEEKFIQEFLKSAEQEGQKAGAKH
ncbi:hypothetical protein BDY17DRAFT_293044 [Neohortaea acidophila]|uniref:ATP synthase subunit K, mitochondrial n=1 Tax=Neohortaea acidophila TaxID=245834 RepID=A0A6A6Q163_9PEZI|nr:uncharacterized protein BDY17DRAFT_293044 [Neohortaea acidophila]KAF2485167.1 hypothetical protein BDY17DRAFT_293044 [Neohortaea acidophila]